MTYKDASTAVQAFEAGKEGLNCTQGTTLNHDAMTFSGPTDVSSDVGAPGAVEFDFETATGFGQFIAVQNDNAVVWFQVAGLRSDPSSLPDALAIARKGRAEARVLVAERLDGLLTQ